MAKQFFIIISSLFFIVCIFSCNEEEINPDSNNIQLTFSSDTVTFDTVFTRIGSTTKLFRVINPGSGAYKNLKDLSGRGR